MIPRSISRQLEFVRHIPPRQILRRFYLSTKRRLLDRICTAGPVPPWGGPPLKPIRTLGLNAPHGSVWRESGVWKAKFLNVEKELGPSIPWAALRGDAGDQLWRMNLHYFEYLPDLSDEVAVQLIGEWIEACRPFDRNASSAAWTPYAISLRISAWLEASVSRRNFGDERFGRLFAGSLREQADYLAAGLETDVRGNHLIKNIRALIEASAAFGMADKCRWGRAARKQLARELPVQVLADGVHFELSPSYHCQVFADFLSIHANLQGPKDLVCQLKASLDRMAQATVDLTHPDGFVAQFGDAGLKMAVAPGECLRAYELLVATAAPQPRMYFAFENAGYYGTRLGGQYFVAKFGHLGADALIAHAHGDWGSFEWSIGTSRLIVDPGVFEYASGRTRDLSKSTSGHNTAALEKGEQGDFFGSFRCGRRAHPRPASYVVKGERIVLNGQLETRDGNTSIVQTRTIEFSPNDVLITDCIEGVAGKSIVAALLFHPDFRSFSAPENFNGTKTLESSRHVVEVTLQSPGDGQLSTEPGKWWPNHGEESPATRSRATGRSELPLSVRIRRVDRS